ncbi:hypothetical protein FRC19_007595 [Serendipita sp. 401]|nr:hypothetical protein FRC19_007595 [Serendipita sp. 401]
MTQDAYPSGTTTGNRDEQIPTTTQAPPTYATVQSMLQVLERRASTLQSEREQAERAYENARRSVDSYKAMVAQYVQEKRDMQVQTHTKTGSSTMINISHLANPPLISRLPLELLIYIFLYVQNTVVTSQVCRYWRHITHSSPRLWSSLHIHPSKGAKYLEQLLERSCGSGPGVGGGVGLDVCFCPVLPPQIKSPHSHSHPHLHPRAHLSHPPVFAFHPSMVLNPQIVSTLKPHVSRLSSFEIHATVPGTWLTLLPMLERPAPELRRMCVFTTLPGDVAQIGFFGHHLRLGHSQTSGEPLQGHGHQHSGSLPQSGAPDGFLRGKPDSSYNPTPKLRNLQMTGGFPLLYHASLLRNLTVLRLEAVPFVYRPNTRQLRGILEACQGLVALSLLDAGPVPESTSPGSNVEVGGGGRVSMKSLKALSFRDTEIHTGLQPQAAGNVLHMPPGYGAPVPGPHPLAYSPAARGFVPTPSPVPQTVPMGGHRPSFPSPSSIYPQMSPNPYSHGQLSVNTLAVGKTRAIFDHVRLLEGLRELYLWTPHADAEDIRCLLNGLKGLESLEMPLVRDPLGAMRLFMSPFSEALTGETASMSPMHDNVGDTQMNSVGGEKGVNVAVSEWLCPNLERMGIPYINGVPQDKYQRTLTEVIDARSNASSSPSRLSSSSSTIDVNAVPLKAILAPSGRPHYVHEDVWHWIGQRMRIETIQSSDSAVAGAPSTERMDTLFDRIVREAS